MTRRAHSYIAYGLSVASDIAIPGAMVAAMPIAVEQADIDIVLGSAELDEGARASGPYRWTSESFEFLMRGVARYVCIGGRQLIIDIAAGADATEVAAMLIATALPAMLWWRGDVVLHAAAVLFPGARLAVAVAGSSGSGKSRFLSRSLAIGATAIADDSLCMRIGPDGLVASGLPGGYFRALPQVGTARDFRPVPADRQARDHTLGALLILTPGISAPRRLGGVAALTAVLRQRHRPRIAQLTGREPAFLPALDAILSGIPIVELPIGA